jgi:hypothetical protein
MAGTETAAHNTAKCARFHLQDKTRFVVCPLNTKFIAGGRRAVLTPLTNGQRHKCILIGRLMCRCVATRPTICRAAFISHHFNNFQLDFRDELGAFTKVYGIN